MNLRTVILCGMMLPLIPVLPKRNVAPKVRSPKDQAASWRFTSVATSTQRYIAWEYPSGYPNVVFEVHSSALNYTTQVVDFGSNVVLIWTNRMTHRTQTNSFRYQTNTAGTWTPFTLLDTVPTQSYSFSATGYGRLFKVRALDTVSGQLSDWATVPTNR